LIVSNRFSGLSGAVGSPALHYGNPLGEQRSLAAGLAIVDLSDRGVISVTGPDRLTWLDSLTSQSLASLAPGSSAETLQLDPTGRIEFAIRVFDDGVTTWLLVDGTETAGLLAWLERMKFMLRIELADRSAEFATIGTLGQLELGAASPNGIPLVWRDPWVSVVAGGHQYASVAEHPGLAWTYSEHLVPRESVVDLVQTPAAGTLALEALRIAAWRPRLSAEVDEKSIPHELDWLRSAVHLNKGCYRGQETVAKVHNLGHPPRRLVLLHLDGSDGVLPAHGDQVLLDDSPIGLVTSAALHYELGPIALAVVKRSVDPAAGLEIVTDGIRLAAAQEVIVPPDAGAEVNLPRIPRLGATQR
jgi:tRNA-modifying protein YgfZ